MSAKLLDGLEMFLGVFVTFLNSSKLQMAGGWHIYRPPSRTSHLEFAGVQEQHTPKNISKPSKILVFISLALSTL